MLLRLGDIFLTKGVEDCIDYKSLHRAICRHMNCDWGELEDEDIMENNRAMARNGSILGCYYNRDGKKFWIITEINKNVTTVLLPEEY